jgi:Ras-related protein Rab-32
MQPAKDNDGVTEYLYKVLVVGDIGTGKTSIIKRYVHNIFSAHYKSTIGVDFALKVINWSPNTIVRLQLWDIAGQERFGNMTRVYYKEAVGAIVVFDVTRAATFDAVQKWKNDIDCKVTLPPDDRPIPVVLLGNKIDLAKESFQKTPSQMEKYCEENGFSGWFETSAKDNQNIEKAFKFLVSKILENEVRKDDTEENDPSKLVQPTPNPPTNGSSCC